MVALTKTELCCGLSLVSEAENLLVLCSIINTRLMNCISTSNFLILPVQTFQTFVDSTFNIKYGHLGLNINEDSLFTRQGNHLFAMLIMDTSLYLCYLREKSKEHQEPKLVEIEWACDCCIFLERPSGENLFSGTNLIFFLFQSPAMEVR